MLSKHPGPGHPSVGGGRPVPLVDGGLMDVGQSLALPFLAPGQLQPGRLLSLLEGSRPAILAGLNW